jgi:hypothetical protein
MRPWVQTPVTQKRHLENSKCNVILTPTMFSNLRKYNSHAKNAFSSKPKRIHQYYNQGQLIEAGGNLYEQIFCPHPYLLSHFSIQLTPKPRSKSGLVTFSQSPFVQITESFHLHFLRSLFRLLLSKCIWFPPNDVYMLS